MKRFIEYLDSLIPQIERKKELLKEKRTEEKKTFRVCLQKRKQKVRKKMCSTAGSNCRPSDFTTNQAYYETDALPTELVKPIFFKKISRGFFNMSSKKTLS